jgi:hypothetical protein
VALGAEVVEIWIRDSGPGPPGVDLEDRHDPAGLGIRQRPQQHAVDDRKDRGRRADPEREREQPGGRKALVAPHHRQRIKHVPEQRLHSRETILRMLV